MEDNEIVKRHMESLNSEVEKTKQLERDVIPETSSTIPSSDNGSQLQIPKVEGSKLPENKELMKQYKNLLKIEDLGIKLDSGQQRIKSILKEYLGIEDDAIIDDDFEDVIVQCDPKDFFDENKRFVSKSLGDFIIESIKFKTFGGTIYYYKEGVYLDNGSEIIDSIVNKALKDMFKKHFAEETKFYIKTSTYIEHNDPEKHLINLKNGLFDLKEMVLKPHDPDIFMVTQLPITYNIGADCPEIKKFIGEIVSESDVDNMQEFIGYCLWRDYHIQKSFMLIGEGANGKSTFINLLKAFLGENNISSVSLQRLDRDRFAVSYLYGKLANLYADLADSALNNTGIFKMLTGGDTIGAEKKYGGMFNFNNYGKMIFSCNKIPETRDDTSAFFRRWIFINFPNIFEGKEDNKNLINELTTEAELSGLLNWSLEGLKRLLTQQKFSSTTSTDKMRDMYERMSSPVNAFVMDCIEQVSGERILKRDLYKAYKKYCTLHNLPLVQDSSFGKKLLTVKGLRLQEVRIGVKTAWSGIRLKNSDKNIRDIRGIDDFIPENDTTDKPEGDM